MLPFSKDHNGFRGGPSIPVIIQNLNNRSLRLSFGKIWTSGTRRGNKKRYIKERRNRIIYTNRTFRFQW